MRTFKLTLYLQIEDEGYDDPDNGFTTYSPSPTDVAKHVEDAARVWGGQFHPGDPLFSANVKTEVVDCRELTRNRAMHEEAL